ncbi:MAG: photosynthetic reaction center cytochrome c subunit [Blastocatellia bacterium]|nr:photosynthetic reaction center cytochrome c subunit [Blastocatellia bacterium]
MTKERLTRAISLTALGLILSFTVMDRLTGDSLAAPGSQEKTAEQVYKNIKSFTGLPASQLDGVMNYMSASLGVGCSYCHTDSWESDDRAAKNNARRMIEMTRAINKTNYGVEWGVVSCYTCHVGRPFPEATPGARQELWQPPPKPDPKAMAALPTIDEVLEKNIRALGGQASIDGLKTRTSRGTLTVENGIGPAVSVPMEIHQKAPNKMLFTAAYPGGAYTEGFDGSASWIADNRKKEGIAGTEPEGRTLGSEPTLTEFHAYIKLRETYPTMRLLGKEIINGREAFLIGATSKSGSRDKIYIDTETGLLIRKHTLFKTVLGMIPEVVDFSDYREVGGVRLPFKIIWSRPPFTWTRMFTEIKHNVPIDDEKFDKPASKQ